MLSPAQSCNPPQAHITSRVCGLPMCMWTAAGSVPMLSLGLIMAMPKTRPLPGVCSCPCRRGRRLDCMLTVKLPVPPASCSQGLESSRPKPWDHLLPPKCNLTWIMEWTMQKIKTIRSNNFLQFRYIYIYTFCYSTLGKGGQFFFQTNCKSKRLKKNRSLKSNGFVLILPINTHKYFSPTEGHIQMHMQSSYSPRVHGAEASTPGITGAAGSLAPGLTGQNEHILF